MTCGPSGVAEICDPAILTAIEYPGFLPGPLSGRKAVPEDVRRSRVLSRGRALRLFCYLEKEAVVELQRDQLLSQRQASKQFRVAAATLRRRVRRGEIATFENPLDERAMLFRVSDLQELARPRPARQDQPAEISAA